MGESVADTKPYAMRHEADTKRQRISTDLAYRGSACSLRVAREASAEESWAEFALESYVRESLDLR